MFQVKTFDETISILKSIFSSFNINAVEITILESLNRVLSEDIHCREDLPGFSRSTMDGFAVKAKNTFGASASLPAMLDLVGEVRMGEVPKFTIQDGQACYIPTGGMLPEGADSVVMIEYAERIDDINVLIERPVSPGENVIHKGEDIKAGDLIFEKGHIIRPQDIGVLSSAGIKTVPVAKRLEFGILSTGNEIADPFQPLPLGKVRDINTYSLAAAVVADTFIPKIYGVIADNEVELRVALQKAIDENDLVLISGGSSVGTHDLTYKVIDSLKGSEILVHGIAIKPGKPTIVARVKDKLVLGLPGNPVSAYLIYYVLIRSFLSELGFCRKPLKIKAKFAENYASAPGRDDCILVQPVEGLDSMVMPVYSKSNMMATMSQAIGYVHLPSYKEGIYKDEIVEVNLF